MPSDIDIIAWYPYPSIELTDTQKLEAAALFDRAACRAIYGLDLYAIAPAPKSKGDSESYWRDMFGYGHDRVSPKGFAKVTL